MKYKCVKNPKKSTVRFFEQNQREWKDNFKKAFKSSFSDKDMLESCIRWIDTLFIERDTLWSLSLKDIENHILKKIKELKNEREG